MRAGSAINCANILTVGSDRFMMERTGNANVNIRWWWWR